MGAVDMGPQESGKKKGGLHKRKGRPNIVLDMTPMVDIGFLLVIFFMTTTRFKEPQAIEITLPPETEPGTEKPVAQSNVLSVNIMKDGTILHNMGFDVPVPVEMPSLDSLMLNSKLDNIKKMPAHIDGRSQVYYESGQDFLNKYDAFMAQNKNKRIPKEIRDSLDMVRDEKICRLTVLVQVNRESSYDKVVAVMDAIQQNQIARFAIVEQTEDHIKAIEEAKKKAASGKGGK
jgi:biopolymer transport protein ExbD